MAVDIRNKFTSRVDDLTWMDDATKAFAKDKVCHIMHQIL